MELFQKNVKLENLNISSATVYNIIKILRESGESSVHTGEAESLYWVVVIFMPSGSTELKADFVMEVGAWPQEHFKKSQFEHSGRRFCRLSFQLLNLYYIFSRSGDHAKHAQINNCAFPLTLTHGCCGSRSVLHLTSSYFFLILHFALRLWNTLLCCRHTHGLWLNHCNSHSTADFLLCLGSLSYHMTQFQPSFKPSHKRSHIWLMASYGSKKAEFSIWHIPSEWRC